MLHSPWFAVSLAIAGMIMGYSLVVFRNGSALAAATVCPAVHACVGADCNNPACANGNCSAECPGNCGKKS